MEITEREQKLLDYINKLIQIITIQAIHFQSLERLRTWILNGMDEIKSKDVEMELVEYLRTEFGIDYEKINEDDLFGKKEI